MGKNVLSLLFVSKKPMTAFLVLIICLELMGVVLLQSLLMNIKIAEAALVTIESSPNTTATVHTLAGSATVFIDDQTGYKFYRYGSAPNNGACVYRKTTNGGNSWGSYVVVDSQSDCIGVTVWYDRWTPGDTGNYIHIATMDTGDDHLFYNRLDTTNDTLLLTTSISTTLGSPATYAAATNRHSITKATDGRVYMVADDAQGSVIVSCVSSCHISTNWSPVGSIPPQGNADSWSILMPLLSGGVMLINRSTGNVLRSSVWNGSNWSIFSTIDSSAIRNTTYDVGMAATLDTDNGDIYLAYVADNDNFTTADHDLRTAIYSSGSWTNKPDIITNDPTRGLLQVAISRDQNNGDIYVAFTARQTIGTANSANTRFVKSTNGMNTWSAESAPVNSATGDFYGIDLNIMSYERIFASWYNAVNSVRSIFGDTIADIGPDVILGTLGSQISSVGAGTNNTYIGGTFSLNTIATRTVSSIRVKESGTINAQNDLANVKLFYEFDNTYPYNCSSESYSGTENQFGSVATGGFSAANGYVTFTHSPLSFNSENTLCFYLVLDVLNSANINETINVSIENPSIDVTVSGDVVVFPVTEVSISGITTITKSLLNQNGFHFRNDDGNEVDASSATNGTENTSLTDLAVDEPFRLRFGVANEGSTSTVPTVFNLEYGTSTSVCEDVSEWLSIEDSNSVLSLHSSTHLTHGQNTTNIPIGEGGVSDGADDFITSNSGIRLSTSNTASVSIGVNEFTEFEYSLKANSNAVEGKTYCLRLTSDQGELTNYSHFPSVTVSADVTVGFFGTQITSAEAGTANIYAGGGFSVTENVSSRNVTEITITDFGTIDVETAVSNVRLYYDLDITFPFDCSGESYSGTESQFGATSTAGFSAMERNATFTDSVTISATSTLCLYVVYDLTAFADNDETIDIGILSPANDVVVSGGGSVGPSEQLNINGITTVEGGILVQTNYHWRNNDGNEANASSATGGTENTPVANWSPSTPIRLRVGVANTGNVNSVPTRFQIEYAAKITTCTDAVAWVDVGVGGDGWEMYDSSFLTNASNTTNIPIGDGGITNGNDNFLEDNGGIRDTESITDTIIMSDSEFTEFEFSLLPNSFVAHDTTYCFRLSSEGQSLATYNNYPEITTASKRDFYIQRGSTQVTGTSTTLFAGSDYVAPLSNSRAFVRITNSHYTGAGHNTGAGGAQNANNVTAYLESANDIVNSFTISRPASASSNTRVDWEMIEFIGTTGSDNEIIVREVNIAQFSSSEVVREGGVVSGIANDTDVVVFLTGSSNQNTSRNYYAGQVTTEWDDVQQKPIFRRGHNGSSVVDISYAVVEFTGMNWGVQRVEHLHIDSEEIELENISPVGSLARTFLHTQKRMGATTNVVHFGYEVWLSSIGAVSFRLEPLADVGVDHVLVAWVIENTQTGIGQMQVHRSNGSTSGGTTPFSLSVNLLTPVKSTNNSSIMANTRAVGANTTYPRPIAGFNITSTSTFEIWRSNTGSSMTYRAEIIEWPVADLSLKQNYYRFYEDNGNLTPEDPWPAETGVLGENTSITINDQTLGVGDRTRLRMTVRVANASLPASTQNFRLQFGERVSTCSAISSENWFNVGGLDSGTIWRGFASLNTTNGEVVSDSPPSGLLISVANNAGSIVHQNPSPTNPYSALEGDDIEYDWHLEQNGANAGTTYCFRMIKNDGNILESYLFYPQARTSHFSPVIKNWRWYNDVNNETPILPSAEEEVTPTEIEKSGRQLALRVSIRETKNVQGDDIKFKLQFSNDVTFSNPHDVVPTSTCNNASVWCYTEGGGIDNNLIENTVLSDSENCVNQIGVGCGTYNTSPTYTTGHTHFGSTTQEYSFTLISSSALINNVYYFRLYDIVNDLPVPLALGASYPSVVIEGAHLVFSVSGLQNGTTTAGVTTDIETNAYGIAFGSLMFNNEYNAAQRLTVETNAEEGYQVFKVARQQLLNSRGISISPIDSTNSAPDSWSNACSVSAVGCFGYHTTDGVLKGGSTRFGAIDTYAGIETEPVEIMHSSIPTLDTHDIVYRIKVSEMQDYGDYETEIIYLAIPSF